MMFSDAIGIAGRLAMNYTISRANRTTHLKIVAIALVAAIAVVAIGINARIGNVIADSPGSSTIVKAGQPATYAGQESSSVR
jgi:hypothetical protein